MAESKNRTPGPAHRSSQRNSSSHGFYTPFGKLEQHLPQNSVKTPRIEPGRHPKRGTERPAERPEDAERIFREAMADVTPLPAGRPSRIPASPSRKQPARFLAQEEMEVYAHLADLVAGDGPFEISWSDEYVDGAVVGLSPEILRKLRRGEFSYQEYMDLHGCKREEAKERTTHFVKRSFGRGLRCILIVSGRGLNSKDKEPVLKHGVVKWLTRAPLKCFVLAFASARSCDGGAGAFYVLLRKNEGKTPLLTPAP